MEHHHHFGILIIGLALAVIAVLAGFLTFQAPITGNVVAIGGELTQVNISVGESNILWVGIYGNISIIGTNGSQEFASGQVFSIDLSFLDIVSNTTFVALSTGNNISWDTLSPASFLEINTYMSLGSSSAYSAENTLTFTHNYSINNITYEAWSAQTNSLNGTYITGAFTDGQELIFMTQVVDNAYGFMNSPTDYQVLFPVSENGTANITFTVFNNDALPGDPLSCNISANFSARIASDNVSVEVYWDAIPGALSYEVLYIEGPSNGFLNFSSATSIPLGTNTLWTDASPSDERYYRLQVNGNIGSCMISETTGTIAVNVSPDFNLLSNPFVAEDKSISEILRPINGKFSEVYEFDNGGKTYNYYIIVGASVFKTFNTITPSKTYWIKTNMNESLRFAGVLHESMNESISPDFNLIGFPTISNNASDDSLLNVFSSITGNFSEVYQFNNDGKMYDYYIIVGASTFKTFNTIKPAKAYWIKTNVNEQLVYENE